MRLHAKKSLGQHFLNSPSVLAKTISAAEIERGETILEIGPGTGVLTTALLDAGAHVVAIEKDFRAYDLLKTKFKAKIDQDASMDENPRNLILINGDILDQVILKSLDIEPLIGDRSYAIVANIPYYITGAILERFLEHEPRPNRMVLLVQEEVADRIMGSQTGSVTSGKLNRAAKESILSISIKAFGTPRIVARVPREAFTPQPNVDSAILAVNDISDVRFTHKNGVKRPDPIDIRMFFGLVRASFAHKRKYLIRNLENISNKELLRGIWQELRLNEKVRAEDLTLEKWFELAERM